MPDDPLVWIIAIIFAAIVLLFALWKGDIVEFTTDPFSLKFKRAATRERAGPTNNSRISVGEGLSIRNSRTGDIAGVKTEGSVGGKMKEDSRSSSIEVGRNASIEDSETGDIAGIKKGGTPGPDS